LAPRHFQISTSWTGRKRTMQVYIHDTAKQLRSAANHYNRLIGSTDKLEHAVGACQSFRREKLVDGSWVQLPAAGIIRLTKNNLTTGVISHEATHMASNIYGHDWLEGHGAPWEDIDNEEILSYLVGDITSKIVRKLYKLGYYE
jgi:hypothetical protein